MEDDDNFGDENGSDFELASAMLLSGEAEEPPDSVVCYVCWMMAHARTHLIGLMRVGWECLEICRYPSYWRINDEIREFRGSPLASGIDMIKLPFSDETAVNGG